MSTCCSDFPHCEHVTPRVPNPRPKPLRRHCANHPRCNHTLAPLQDAKDWGNSAECGKLYWGKPPKSSAGRMPRLCLCTRAPGHEDDCHGRPVTVVEHVRLRGRRPLYKDIYCG